MGVEFLGYSFDGDIRSFSFCGVGILLGRLDDK